MTKMRLFKQNNWFLLGALPVVSSLGALNASPHQKRFVKDFLIKFTENLHFRAKK